MKKTIKTKVKSWIKSNIIPLLCFIGIIIAPIIVEILFNRNCSGEFKIDSGHLLSFYGAALGIFSSFITYITQKNKSTKERFKAIMPRLSFYLVRRENESKLYDLEIINNSKNPLSYVSLYNEVVADRIQNKKKLCVSYGLTVEEAKKLNPDYNFSEDGDLIEEDGYPKEINITCEDVDKNGWICSFSKIKYGDDVYYYPKEFEIV